MRILIILLILIIILPLGAHGDSYMSEKVNIWSSQLPDSILSRIEGIISIQMYVIPENMPKVYQLHNDKFQVVDTLDIFQHAFPVSHFGYPVKFDENPRRMVPSWFRLPVIETDDDYLRIVLDCKTMKTVWLKNSDLQNTYDLSIVYYHSLHSKSKKVYLDFDFSFAPGWEIRVYESPSLDSKFKVYRHGIFTREMSPIFVVDQVSGFVKINGATNDLGWIKIRDNAGKPNFWIKAYDEDDC